MRACRDIGITSAKYKGSMSLAECVSFINSSGLVNNPVEMKELDINPLEYYLENKGFGVVVNSTEMHMIEQYLVNGTPYL
jgi:hypothetical protein